MMAKQKDRKKRMLYTHDSLDLAVKAVHSGMAINAASTKFKVPRLTLHSKVYHLHADKKPGPSSILPADQEELLVKWILHCGAKGHPVTKSQLLNSVRMIVAKMNVENPFNKDSGPGRSWYSGFLGRHREISLRMAETVSSARATVSEDALRKWFSTIKDYLEEECLLDIHPSRVFNTDETALPLSPKSDRVLGRKGSKDVYIRVNNEKENVTLLVSGNAAGQIAPPLLMFNYKRIPLEIYEKMPPGWSYGTSDSGWMQGENFFEYIANVFHPWLKAEKIALPVILYVDGHVSHLTLPLAQFCSENQIVLIALHPNSTHIIQPMDQSMFRPVKAAWKKQVNSYRQEYNCFSVQKADVAREFQKVLNNLDTKAILKNGFRACGLMPFSADGVNYEKVMNRSKTQKHSDEQINEQQLDVQEKSSYVIVIKCIEERIDFSTLKQFQLAHEKNDWTGETENKNLFNVWNHYKNLVKADSHVNDSIEQEIVAQENSIKEKDSSVLDIEGIQPDQDILMGVSDENLSMEGAKESDDQLLVEKPNVN